jgi:hypothetical protein
VDDKGASADRKRSQLDRLEWSTGHVASLAELWSTGHDGRSEEWSAGQVAVDDEEHDEAMSKEPGQNGFDRNRPESSSSGKCGAC